MAHHIDLSALDKDPRLFLYTSLTAGSSHIITATSRLETILKANKIPFQAVDVATDERARRLWQRRSQGKKLPGLVKEGYVLGDLEEIEEWNEFGELKENIGPVPASDAAAPPGGLVGVSVAPPIAVQHPFTGQAGAASAIAPRAVPVPGEPAQRVALPGAAEIAAMAKARVEAAGKKREEEEGEKNKKEKEEEKKKEEEEKKEEEKKEEETEEEKDEEEEGEKPEVPVESQTGITGAGTGLTTAAGEAVKPISDLDLETKDASGVVVENAGKEQNTNAGQEEGAASTADASIKHANKHEEHAVPVKSQTGETSSVPQMTTAAGEPVKPIEDADVEAHDALTASTSKLDVGSTLEQAAPPAAEGKATDGNETAEGSAVETKAEQPSAVVTGADTSNVDKTEADEADSSKNHDKSDETIKGVQGLAIKEEQHEQPETHTQTQDAKAPEHAQESVKD